MKDTVEQRVNIITVRRILSRAWYMYKITFRTEGQYQQFGLTYNSPCLLKQFLLMRHT